MPIQKGIHFNGLNGIRAICALAVVVSHTSLALNELGLIAGNLFGFAAYGVTAFFSLSGFLITYLLIQEKDITATVAVKKFYLRRILRIWPLYFGYLVIAVITDVFIFHYTDFSSIGFYLFFFPNIPFAYYNAGITTVAPILLLSHFWSLGVEEQFYAFYPWLIKIFKKIFTVLIMMFCIMMLLKVVAKFCSYKTGNPFWYALIESMPFEAMAIGGLGAWFYKQHNKLVLKIIKIKFLQIIITAVIVLILIKQFKIVNPFADIIISIMIVIVIYYAHLLEKPILTLKINTSITLEKSLTVFMFIIHSLQDWLHY